VTCDVSTAAALRKSLGGLPTAPPSLEGLVTLGITPPSVAQFELKAKTTEVAWESGKTKAEFVVEVDRKKGFAEAVDLNVYGLPAGFKAAVVKIDKTKKDGTVVIEGPAAPKDFRQSLQIVGSAIAAKRFVQASLLDVALVAGKKAESKSESKDATADGPAKAGTPTRKPTRVEP
jgi:hypothetical protein